MSENVYIFGAGINRSLNDWHGLVPPLATDFFQQAFHSEKYFSEHYLNKIQDLTEFIEKFWKLSREDLKKVPFDLEACFTLIQLQSLEAQQKGDRDTTTADRGFAALNPGASAPTLGEKIKLESVPDPERGKYELSGC